MNIESLALEVARVSGSQEQIETRIEELRHSVDLR